MASPEIPKPPEVLEFGKIPPFYILDNHNQHWSDANASLSIAANGDPVPFEDIEELYWSGRAQQFAVENPALSEECVEAAHIYGLDATTPNPFIYGELDEIGEKGIQFLRGTVLAFMTNREYFDSKKFHRSLSFHGMRVYVGNPAAEMDLDDARAIGKFIQDEGQQSYEPIAPYWEDFIDSHTEIFGSEFEPTAVQSGIGYVVMRLRQERNEMLTRYNEKRKIDYHREKNVAIEAAMAEVAVTEMADEDIWSGLGL